MSKQMAEQVEQDTVRGKVEVAACNGLMSARVIGRAVHAAIAVVPGGPVARQSFSLPFGARVVALSPNGHAFVDDTGACWCWAGNKYVRAYDATEAGQ
jgi:hypothetical protein